VRSPLDVAVDIAACLRVAACETIIGGVYPTTDVACCCTSVAGDGVLRVEVDTFDQVDPVRSSGGGLCDHKWSVRFVITRHVCKPAPRANGGSALATDIAAVGNAMVAEMWDNLNRLACCTPAGGKITDVSGAADVTDGCVGWKATLTVRMKGCCP